MYAIKSACNISKLCINKKTTESVKIYYSIYKYRVIKHEYNKKRVVKLIKDFCSD